MYTSQLYISYFLPPLCTLPYLPLLSSPVSLLTSLPPSLPLVIEPECEKSSATTYFWYRQTLNITSTIEDSGGLNWKMTLSLFAAWLIVCLAVIKGIQSSGKVTGR